MKHGTWNKNAFALDIPVNYWYMFYAMCSMTIVLYFPVLGNFKGRRHKDCLPILFLLLLPLGVFRKRFRCRSYYSICSTANSDLGYEAFYFTSVIGCPLQAARLGHGALVDG